VTELAYLDGIEAAYRTTFRGRVVALPPGGVVLDRTFFYPTGGGQPSDRGHLRGPSGTTAEVVDVTKSGSSVIHRLRPSAGGVRGFSVGEEVDGAIDWPRRHRHMRLHTAQHLLSARLFVRARTRTRRANLSGLGATLDLDGPVDPALLPELDSDFLEAVAHPRSVTVRYVRREEWDRNPTAERSGLVPLPPQVDPVRVVEVEGLDECPCGGTHIRSTAEIGAVRIAPPTPLAGGASRVSFTLVDPGPTTPPA
jgi:misacylated tRNA(Ala) deacylase